MKKAVYLAAVFFIGLMASCIHNGQNKPEEKKVADTIIQEAPTEPVDTIPDIPAINAILDSSVIFTAEDTLWHEDYLFASYPIPDTVKARMDGLSMKENPYISYDQLRYLTVFHYDFDSLVQKGELVCNQSIAHDLLCVFRDLFAAQYPICSIRLVDDFDADDETSMQANNTSCFNYRTVPGSSGLSQHALGRAIDVNPLQNPYIKGSHVYPATATEYIDRTKDFPHKIDKDDLCYKVFASYGFTWGGYWRDRDYQHFVKRR